MVTGAVQCVTSARKLPFKDFAVTGVAKGSSNRPSFSNSSFSMKFPSAPESTKAWR